MKVSQLCPVWLSLADPKQTEIICSETGFSGAAPEQCDHIGGSELWWEWGWGDQELFSHPGWASKDHGVSPILDISVCLSDPASALQIPALKADLQQCHHAGLLPSDFHWVWSVGEPAGGRRGATSLSDKDCFSSTKGLGSCQVAPLLHSNYNYNTVSSKSFLPHLLWAQDEKFSCVRRREGWRLSPSLVSWFQMCYSLSRVQPGSSVHGILQARIHHSLLQGIFPTQGSNLGFLHCRQILYHLSH